MGLVCSLLWDFCFCEGADVHSNFLQSSRVMFYRQQGANTGILCRVREAFFTCKEEFGKHNYIVRILLESF